MNRVGHVTVQPGDCVKRSDHGPMPVLVVFLVLTSIVPSRLVVPGLGAAGRPANLLAVAMLMWWALLRLLPKQDDGVRVPIRWALYVYLLAHLAAVIAGLDRGLPGIELRSMDRFVLSTLGIAGVILVCIDGLETRRQVENVVAWIVGLGAISAAAGIIQFSTGFNPAVLVKIPGLTLNAEIDELATRGAMSFRRAEGFTLHSIELGVVMGAILPMSLYLARARSKRWYFASALIAGVIPMSVTRTGVLAVVVSMALYAIGWSWRERANAFIIAIVGTFVYSAITPGLLGTIRSLFTNIQSDNSTTGRTEDVDAVGRYISVRPIFGRGPGTFIPSEYRLLDNAYLLELIEAGWVGLISLIALLCTGCATAFWLVRTSEDEMTRGLARVLGGAVAVMLIGFATYDAMSYPTQLAVMSVSLGCLGALYRFERSPEDVVDGPVDMADDVPNGSRERVEIRG